MPLKLEYKPYKRAFKLPLQSLTGKWEHREGILVRVTDKEGRRGYGEVAPLERFGTESTKESIDLLQELKGRVDSIEQTAVLNKYPCTAFAIQSAIKDLGEKKERAFRTVLLTDSPQSALKQGRGAYSVLKIKIGQSSKEEEQEAIRELSKTGCKVRLDFNERLDLQELRWWLEKLESIKGIEFVEQPVKRGQEAAMLEQAKDFKTMIALDESINSLDDIEAFEAKGFRGIYVIKPSSTWGMGRVGELNQNALQRIVYSTVLETSIGIESCLGAIPDTCTWEIGFGAQHFLDQEALYCHGEGPELYYGRMTETEKEGIWTQARWE